MVFVGFKGFHFLKSLTGGLRERETLIGHRPNPLSTLIYDDEGTFNRGGL